MTYCTENNVIFRLDGNMIRKLRQEKGLTQVELAADLCLEQCQISHIENNGSRRPRIDTVMMLSDYFQVDINILLTKEVIK